MIVTVAENVVQAVVGTPDAAKLHTLLGFAVEGRHVVCFDPPSCVNNWLASVDAGSRGGYETALKNAGRIIRGLPQDAAALKIDQIATLHWGDPEAVLPLDDALKVLKQKLGFLLENANNDWHFLLGIMPKSQRQRIQRALEQGWAEAVHGGGSTIVALLQARFAEKHEHEGLRTALMFDSDRLHPNELAENWQPNQIVDAKKECPAHEWEKLAKEKLPKRYWRLQRRFIESYMPKAEFGAALKEQDKTAAVEAFWRMAQEQRWYFNMKKGLKQDEQHQSRQRGMYDTLSDSDKTALQSGFGKDFANHYAAALERDFAWDEAARQEAENNLHKFLRLL